MNHLSPTAVTSPPPREREDRREAILDAAQALIVEGGLEGFRIREVAQRAGMHHASLLHYFPNREALIRGVVARIAATLDRVPAPNSIDAALPPRTALSAHFQHLLAQFQTHPEHFIVLNEISLRTRRDPASAQVQAELDAGWRGYLVPLLAAGRAAGVFPASLDPEAAAQVIMSCFKGLSEQPTLSAPEGQRAITQLERWVVGEMSLHA